MGSWGASRGRFKMAAREAVMMVRFQCVQIAACAHAVCFCYGNIAIVVEMPTAFGQKFDFDAQQIGLQYIAIIIGCVLGEQLSGPMSDWWLKYLNRRRGHTCPADRLWIGYIGYGTVIAGLLTWGFQLERANKTWNVTPCVGAAIASFGNQMLTTILTSFAVDSYKELSTTVGVFVNICRQIFGFVSLTASLMHQEGHWLTMYNRSDHSISLPCSRQLVFMELQASCVPLSLPVL